MSEKSDAVQMTLAGAMYEAGDDECIHKTEYGWRPPTCRWRPCTSAQGVFCCKDCPTWHKGCGCKHADELKEEEQICGQE